MLVSAVSRQKYCLHAINCYLPLFFAIQVIKLYITAVPCVWRQQRCLRYLSAATRSDSVMTVLALRTMIDVAASDLTVRWFKTVKRVDAFSGSASFIDLLRIGLFAASRRAAAVAGCGGHCARRHATHWLKSFNFCTGWLIPLMNAIF